MSLPKTQIDGYEIEFAVYDAEITNCYIYHRRSRSAASLACLLDTGELAGPRDSFHKVDPSTIDAIESWAVENGY